MAEFSESAEREVDAFLDEFEQRLEEDPESALDLARALPVELSEHPDVKLARARAVWALHGAEAARPVLEDLVTALPRFSDAHHVLACVYEELGNARLQIRHNLIVRELDAEQDEEEEIDLEAFDELIEKTAEEALERLPSPFRERLRDVPILIEDRPSVALVKEGFDPRALGLFEGLNDEQRSAGEVAESPTRIVLYSANLLATFSDEDELRHEVEVTLRHEIGHFFGLDEDDLERLGLD